MEKLLTLRSDNKSTIRDMMSLRGIVKQQMDGFVTKLCTEIPAIFGKSKELLS